LSSVGPSSVGPSRAPSRMGLCCCSRRSRPSPPAGELEPQGEPSPSAPTLIFISPSGAVRRKARTYELELEARGGHGSL
jgi:hypothetical protein